MTDEQARNDLIMIAILGLDPGSELPFSWEYIRLLASKAVDWHTRLIRLQTILEHKEPETDPCEPEAFGRAVGHAEVLRFLKTGKWTDGPL